MSTHQPASTDNDETNPETVVVSTAKSAATAAYEKSARGQLIAISRLQLLLVTLTVERPTDSRLVGKKVSIESLPFTLGWRACDLTLAEAQGVSRKHAEITLQDGVFCIEDMGSMNHTFLDHHELQANVPTPLYDGAAVRLGEHTVLRFERKELRSNWGVVKAATLYNALV